MTEPRSSLEHVGSTTACPICAGLGWLTTRSPIGFVTYQACWACTPQPIAA